MLADSRLLAAAQVAVPLACVLHYVLHAANAVGHSSGSDRLLPMVVLFAAVAVASSLLYFWKAQDTYQRIKGLHSKVTFSPDIAEHKSMLAYVETELSRTVSVTSSSTPLSLSRNSSRRPSSTAELKAIVDVHEMLDLIQDSPSLQNLTGDFVRWDYDMFDLAEKSEHALVIVGFSCLEVFTEVDFDKMKLTSFLGDIERKYKHVPYHNQLHGATVARTAFSMCKHLGLEKALGEELQFALVFAGLIHDVAHPGLTAPFLSRTQHELSVRYSDESPLEHHHLATAFTILNREANDFLSPEVVNRIKRPIVKAVLGTDMAKHGEQVQRLNALIDNLLHGGSDRSIPWYWPAKPPPACQTPMQKAEWETQAQREFVLEMYLHAADIASPTMPFDQFKRWNNLVQAEFHAQGDLEKQQLGFLISVADGYDRNVSAARLHNFTCGFVKFLVQPLYIKLDEWSNAGKSSNLTSGVDLSTCLTNLEANIKMLDETAPAEES